MLRKPVGWRIKVSEGNELAWKSRRWRSVEHFKEHQRGWAIAGVLIGAPLSLLLWWSAIALLTHVR
jgi:hypothetical protein